MASFAIKVPRILFNNLSISCNIKNFIERLRLLFFIESSRHSLFLYTALERRRANFSEPAPFF